MSRTIEIRGLTDAQCDALADEAKARGVKFFDHCRDRLLANLTVAAPPAYGRGPALQAAPLMRQENAKVKVEVAGDDRIGRLEAMMAQMAETVNLLAVNPSVVVGTQPVADGGEVDIDLDDVIGQSLAVAEREGLTVVEREQPAASGGVRHVGTRRPAPFSVNSVPQHLRNL